MEVTPNPKSKNLGQWVLNWNKGIKKWDLTGNTHNII